MADRGVEFRRNKMKVRAVFALAGSVWREEKEDMKEVAPEAELEVEPEIEPEIEPEVGQERFLAWQS
ncbi:hypothetical protein EV426DRAFT_719840 [Tirmania nivea]|nr:hypothetical protein EV426DRAFT_719840 [Tirmania nivea]